MAAEESPVPSVNDLNQAFDDVPEKKKIRIFWEEYRKNSDVYFVHETPFWPYLDVNTLAHGAEQVWTDIINRTKK